MKSFVDFFRTAALSVLILSPAVAWSDVEVIYETANDVSPPLLSISTDQLNATEASKPLRIIPLMSLSLPAGTRTLAADTVVQSAGGPLIAVTAGYNFDGVGQGFTGPQGAFTVTVAPSDSNGAVGDTQYVQWVNTSFAVFSKANGSVIYGPVPGNTIWQGFGGQCQSTNDGDPIAAYDKASHRWVMSQFSISGGVGKYYQCIAISVTSDATGSYYRYAFPMPNFNDYPKLGVWPDGYYASFNMFSGNTLLGARACAFDRSKMLIGAAATAQCFQLGSSYAGLLPSDLDGTTPPPIGSPNYFINFGTNSLNRWKFHVDFNTPANSSFIGPTSISVAAFSPACSGSCIPQAGSTQLLDGLGDRLMYRVAYRNFGNHESLVLNHSVIAGNSFGVRWYEIRNPGANVPTVYQQSTYAPDAIARWMGSIAMDAVGNIAMGYSASSSSISPSVRYTGRLATDPLDTLETENVIISGGGSQTPSLSRWGDYTSITIDPVDDCTFWYTDQYLKTTGQFNWSTRIASFKFPNCLKQANIQPIINLLLLK